VAGTSAEQLVKAWETGKALVPAARAVELLAALEPDVPSSVLASLSIGERDRRLLRLRREVLGRMADATVLCPHCEERIEFAIDVESLIVAPHDGPARAVVDVDGMTLDVRVLTSTDLLELARSPSGMTELTLMRRCVTRMTKDGVDIEPSALTLSPVARDAVATTIAELDPQADVQLSMSCPICDYQWSADLDVAAYVWAELTFWVRQLLVDVHRLALAYGWRESDILAMSNQRRGSYLELIGA